MREQGLPDEGGDGGRKALSPSQPEVRHVRGWVCQVLAPCPPSQDRSPRWPLLSQEGLPSACHPGQHHSSLHSLRADLAPSAPALGWLPAPAVFPCLYQHTGRRAAWSLLAPDACTHKGAPFLCIQCAPSRQAWPAVPLQASVPSENTGPLFEKQEKGFSCGFLTHCSVFLFSIQCSSPNADPRRGPCPHAAHPPQPSLALCSAIPSGFTHKTHSQRSLVEVSRQ